MRKKQTFLLTVMTPETGTAFCGQIKVIASGKTRIFTSLEELYQLLSVEMNEEAAPLRTKIDAMLSEEKAIF